MGLRTETVKSVGEYMKLFAEIEKDWSDERGELLPWARGQSDATWPLVPGEYRGGRLNCDEIRSEFQLKALPMLVVHNFFEWFPTSFERRRLHIFRRVAEGDHANRMKMLGNAEQFPQLRNPFNSCEGGR